MSQIKNLAGMTHADLNRELSNGAKFVVYEYSISVILMSFKNGSDIHFVRAGESGFGYGIKYSLISLVLGWWGIPWGPIYTIGSLITNCAGGKDVTYEVTNTLRSSQTVTSG